MSKRARGALTPEGRLVYAIVAGIANTLLLLGALGITGMALGFAGLGSGSGWEPVAALGLVGWLGGLSGVLAMTRSLFLGQRLPIASVVGACVVATAVTLALAWGLVGGGVVAFLLIACSSAAAAYAVI